MNFEELIQKYGTSIEFEKAFDDYVPDSSLNPNAFFSIFLTNNSLTLRIPNAGGMVEINLSPKQEAFVQDVIMENLPDVSFSWGIWDTQNPQTAQLIIERLQQHTSLS